MSKETMNRIIQVICSNVKTFNTVNLKKSVALLTIYFLFNISLFSETFYYYGNGFSSAVYKGTTANVRAYNLWVQQKRNAAAHLYKINQLTDEDRKFLWGALNKYNYHVGEVYMILISPGDIYFTQTFIYVEIQKDKSIIWYGWRG